eukprot:scpid62007/ scgid4014/ 
MIIQGGALHHQGTVLLRMQGSGRMEATVQGAGDISLTNSSDTTSWQRADFYIRQIGSFFSAVVLFPVIVMIIMILALPEVRRVLYYRYMAAVAIVTSVCAMLAVVALNSPHNSLKCRVGGVCMQSLITLLVCLASCMAVEDYLYTLRRYSPEFVRYTRNACQVGMITITLISTTVAALLTTAKKYNSDDQDQCWTWMSHFWTAIAPLPGVILLTNLVLTGMTVRAFLVPHRGQHRMMSHTCLSLTCTVARHVLLNLQLWVFAGLLTYSLLPAIGSELLAVTFSMQNCTLLVSHLPLSSMTVEARVKRELFAHFQWANHLAAREVFRQPVNERSPLFVGRGSNYSSSSSRGSSSSR